MVEVRDCETSLDLKAADDATNEWVMLSRDAAGFALVSDRNRRNGYVGYALRPDGSFSPEIYSRLGYQGNRVLDLLSAGPASCNA